MVPSRTRPRRRSRRRPYDGPPSRTKIWRGHAQARIDCADDVLSSCMSARWRPAVWRLIGQFCAHEGWLHGVPVAAPNGYLESSLSTPDLTKA